MSNVPYSKFVGSVMYLMVCNRSDLAYALSVLSRYMSNPGKEHQSAMKWELCKPKSTVTTSSGIISTTKSKYVTVTEAIKEGI
uniref:Retrovirus-related Pol polyprotein from transposon TNT 1-94 n=1 Tax=Cannabis sativa TaxID=3483 RepID=A0A803PAI6_CANSA